MWHSYAASFLGSEEDTMNTSSTVPFSASDFQISFEGVQILIKWTGMEDMTADLFRTLVTEVPMFKHFKYKLGIKPTGPFLCIRSPHVPRFPFPLPVSLLLAPLIARKVSVVWLLATCWPAGQTAGSDWGVQIGSSSPGSSSSAPHGRSCESDLPLCSPHSGGSYGLQH